MSAPDPALADRVEHLMHAMGFSCNESFSIAVRVHPETVGRWRRGEELPGPVHVAQMARFRGVTAEEMAAHLRDGAPLPAPHELHPSVTGNGEPPPVRSSPGDESRVSQPLDRMLLAFSHDSKRMQRVSEGLLSIVFDEEDSAHRAILAWALERGGKLRNHANQDTLQDLARGSIEELRAILSQTPCDD